MDYLFGKISIFRRFKVLLFNRLFDVDYHKTHFPGLDCLKKKDAKMANFGPKPWTNPFGKVSIFDIFKFLFLLPRKAKTHCPGLDCLKKKKMKKRPFLDQNRGLTSFEKSQFLTV